MGGWLVGIIMIMLQFDGRYYDRGVLTLRSLALHEPGKRVLADTINLMPEQVEELQRSHPQVTVKNDTVTWSETSRELMSNRKAFVLRNAMNAYPGEPFYGLFDADLLVRRPLNDLWSLLDNDQAALIITNGMWNGRVYPRLITVSSIVLVRPSGRALIDSWAKWHFYDKPIDSIEPRQWFWDQVTLLGAWCETSLSCARIPINVFADVGLSSQSAIWSANVPDKKRYHDIFQREYERQKRSAISYQLSALRAEG